jgi:hypothetical protein
MLTAAQKFVTIPLMVVLTLTAAITASGGEYCKWTDENGVVHYDEKCPGSVTSAVVATEGERTESQIKAAEEHSKSLLSKPTQPIKSTGKSQGPDSETHAGVTADSSPQNSKDLSQMSFKQLDTLCGKEREKRLAPEREQLIQNCITNQRKSPEYCERYYRDYGAAQRIDGTDYVQPALYIGLPECVAAEEAKKKGR